MTDYLILGATLAGALIQVAVGVGFSIVCGPLLVFALGAKAAVPVLLTLNLVVSLIGLWGFRRKTETTVIGQSVFGGLIGIVIGTVTFPALSDTFVTVVMALVLLGGAIPGLVPPGHADWRTVVGLGSISGIATAWTATPGPVMALGLILAGYPGTAIRQLVQPIALVCYGAALAMLGRAAWANVASSQHILPLLLATIVGSVVGLVVGPRLPSQLITPAIRAFATIAGTALLGRAIFS